MRRSSVAAIRPLLLATWAAACGIPSPSVSSTTAAESTAVDPSLPVDEDDDDDDDDDGQALCEAEIAALAPFVTDPEGGCSVLLRLDHETREVLGYQSLCAPYSDLWLDESQARDLTQCCTSEGTVLNPPSDQGLWVFYQEPAPTGAVAVVSNHTAQRLLEGTIVWNGTGELVQPTVWLEPEGFGSDCGMIPMPEIDSYDLAVGGGAIASDDIAEAWDAVSSSALPRAMSTVGQLQRASLLRYAPSVGPMGDPTTHEYLMVLEGGIARDDPGAGAMGGR